MKKIISLVLCLCLMLAVLPMAALAADKPVYLALGDSITSGYGLEDPERCFTNILADIKGYELVNLGMTGNTAAGVRAQVQSGEIDDLIASAELITITCGGNDMLNLVYEKAAEAYNAVYNPDISADDVVTILNSAGTDQRFMNLVTTAMSVLNGDEKAGIPPFVESDEFFAAVSEYAGNLDEIMYTINEINSKAIVIVTTQYNPYKHFTGIFATVAQQLDEGIVQLNGPITHPDGHTYADVYAAFNQIGGQLTNATENPLNLDFHPNAAGHEVIAATVLAKLDLLTAFTDVTKGKYFYEPVIWAVEKGVTSGTSETTFSPGNECSRAQVVTFLWRAAGEPEPETAVNPFEDVNESNYYYKAVLWANENNITTGTSATTFSPGNKCSRGQVVTFLWRAEGKPEPMTEENPFDDVKEDSYYYKAVLWANENNITTGTSSNTFAPGTICNRGQVVTFLYRAKTN